MLGSDTWSVNRDLKRKRGWNPHEHALLSKKEARATIGLSRHPQAGYKVVAGIVRNNQFTQQNR